MCYDISFQVNIAQLSDYFPDLVFDEQIELNLEAGAHILGQAFGEHAIIYANQEDGRLHCRLMEWGVIPFYQKDEKSFVKRRATNLNARSEKVLDDTKSYWYKIRNRRCLIPVTGFYEHRGIKGWVKKVPYLISLKDQQPLFFLHGLYSVAHLPDPVTQEIVPRWTYTILTRSSIGNDVLTNIHNDGENRHRMVLLLPFEMSKEFVQKDLSEERYREILNYEMPPDNIAYDTVFTIRSPKERPDGKPKTAHWEWEKLPELGVGNPD